MKRVIKNCGHVRIEEARCDWLGMQVALATAASFKLVGKQNPRNEDRAVVAGNLVAVLDGATSVATTQTIDGCTTAEYISKWSAEWLNQHSTTKLEARSYLINLNSAFAKHLAAKAAHIAALGKLGPAATATLVTYSAENDLFNYAHVGDSVLLVKNQNNSWQRVTQDLVAPSALVMRAKLKQLRDNGDPNLESLILQNEKEWRETYYNSSAQNGFGMLNGEAGMDSLVAHGDINASSLSELILMSDGGEYPSEEGGLLRGANLISENGPSAYIEHLIALYESDPERIRFARGKHSDDITVLHIKK